MEINYFVLTAIIIVLIIETIVSYYLIKYYRLRKIISSSKTSKISDFRDGFRVIKGRVIALSEPLISPYAKTDCVYYDFQVEEKRRSGNTDAWDNLIKDEKMQMFGVHDGSGMAVVDLKNAKIELKSDNEFNPVLSPHMKDLSYSNRERLLKRYGVKSYNGKYERTVKYRELIIEEGVQIYVMGETDGKSDGHPLFKVQGKPLYVSDHSEKELLKLYTNKIVYWIAIMIGIPLGFLLLWLIQKFQLV